MKLMPLACAAFVVCLMPTTAAPQPDSVAINGAAVISTPPEVFSLPLPKGQKMNFVLLRISQEDSLFVPIMYDMGCGDTLSYEAKSTPTSVSGTVYVTKGKYWAIPVAQTELTRAQYAAVMTPDQMPSDEEEALMPQTGISRLQMLQFAEKLNTWCMQNKAAADALRKAFSEKLHGLPYLRLPRESEWEFAARGALHVSAADFRKQHPYDSAEALDESEVLFRSDGASVCAVAATQITNPCGLYDMLGNVEEMVDGDFSPEYYYGRVGGVTVRGGSSTTQLNNVASYMRQEYAAYNSKTKKPFSSASVGCRFVLGSMVYPATLTAEKKKDADGNRVARLVCDWKAYVSSDNALRYYPLSSPGDSTSDKLAKELASLLNSGDTDAEAITARIAEMQKIVDKSAATTAEAALLTVYYAGAPAWEDVMFLIDRRKVLEDESISSDESLRAVIEEEIAMVEPNMDVHWENYVKGCRAMLTVDKEILADKVKARRAQILSRPTQAQRDQIQVFDYCMRFFEDNFRTKTTFDEQDKQQWLSGFSSLSPSSSPTTH